MGQIDSINNSRLQENFFLTFWILVCAASLFFFLKTDYRLSFSGEQKKIGQIQSIAETAKIKGPQALSWFQALEGQSLHHFDQIYTHQGAMLEIDLFESGQLVVHENTLLRLVDTQKGTSVDLGQGLISATLSGIGTGNGELVFSVNGKIYQLSSSNAQVQIINDKKSAQVQLISGSLSLTSDEEVITFNPDQQLTIESDGVRESSVFQAELLAPAHQEVFTTASQRPVTFQWISPVGVILRVGQDPHFKTVIHRAENSLEKQRLELFPGVYYWRLESLDGVNLGVVRKFEVVQEKSPSWISPRGLNTQIRLERQSEQAKSVPLSWKSEGQQHLLQIGLRNEDQSIEWIMDEVVSGHVYELKLEQRGEYVARVKIADSQREEALWSHDIFFRVWSHELKTPRHMRPKDRSKFIIFEQNSYQKISWRGFGGIDTYQVRWKNPQGEESSQVTTETQFDLPLDGGGQYQWQVRSVDGDEFSHFSDWITFEIQKENFNPSVPDNGVLIELDRPDQLVRFEWARAQNVEDYIFQMSDVQDFSTISHELMGKLPRTEVKVAQVGVFYWRTKVITKDGKEYFSNPYRVIIEPSAPPEKPKVKGRLKIEYLKSSAPEIQKSFLQSLLNLVISQAYAEDENSQQALAQNFAVKISWPKGPENIKAYKIRIFQKDQVPVLELLTEETEIIWEQAFAGEFYWEVAYQDYWERLGPFSEPELFVVTDQDKLNVVKFSDILDIRLIRPRHGQKIEEQAELFFTWELSPQNVVVDTYRLEIATDLAMTEMVFSRDFSHETRQFVWQKTSQIPLPLFWRVTAVQGEVKTLSLRRRLDLNKRLNKKAAILAEDKTKVEKPKPKIQSSLNLYFQAALYNFEQDLSQTIVIDGQSVMGFRFDWNFSQGSLTLQNNGGKVFNDQSFRRTNFSYTHHLKHFSEVFTFSAVANILRASSYEISKQKILESAKIDMAAGLALSFRSAQAEARATVVFGSYLSPTVEAFWHTKWLSLGIGYEIMALSDERSLNGVKINLGQSFSF